MNLLILAAAALSSVMSGETTWGGRDRHPATVNAVCAEPSGDVISLRGKWEFTTAVKDLPNRNGCWHKIYREEWKASREIEVPGCWEAQGVGEPGMGEAWDCRWDHAAKPIRHKYRGEGWYRRTVKIPSAWAGKRIWLKFGGITAIGWVWVNDRQVALVNDYCASVKYEITDLVKPGEVARIVVDVDNRKPSRKGEVNELNKWGGIYRDVELEATPQVFIDDAWIRGDFDGAISEAHVELGAADGYPLSDVRLRFSVEGVPVETKAKPGENVVKLPLGNFRPWSPEHPNLYTGLVELVENGKVVQSRKERFGIRKLEVRGKEFYLNGKPFYFRGFGDDSVYPLAGLPPADRDVHRAHLAKARAAGFNYVRLHTHCELPEYFDAADELGVMVQPELPYYSDVPTEGFAFDPVRDVTELWQNFRRHPSFAVYSMGNEGSFGDSLDRHLHRYVKAMDPDRLKINQDTNRPELSTADRSDYEGGPVNTWERGSQNPDRPFVTHEYLNLCVKHDSRSEGKYTGVWQPPTTRAARGQWLARFGLDHEWGDRLQDAQHALQAVWQKRGIEAARIDPYCDGYIFWTIVDVVVWNDAVKSYSAQGLFDPFWEDKPRGLSAADFAAFNSPSCVLMDLKPARQVFTAGESVKVDVRFAHYGDEALTDAQLEWKLVADGRTLASGTKPVGDLALGPVRSVADLDFRIPDLSVPVRATFVLTLTSQLLPSSNSWPLWLFPKGRTLAAIRERAAKLGIAIGASDSAEAKAALAAGRPLVTVDGTDGETNVRLGWWWMGSQVGTAIKPHPALGRFPHDGVLNPLLFRILKTGRELPVAAVKPEDMIIVGEGGQKCYLYLAQYRVGRSTVVACYGLDLLSDLPEANALLDGFVDELAR